MNHETRFSAHVTHSAVLWERRASGEYSVLDDALTNCLSVSQVDQGTAGDAHGKETETNGTRAATTGIAWIFHTNKALLDNP